MFCSACGVVCARNANYCHLCRTSTNTLSCVGCGLQTLVAGTNTCDRCKKIQEYFHLGYPYLAIVDLLKKDGMSISLRTLKRKLSKLGLSRRGQNIDEDAITTLIRQEIQGAGRLAGYRSIWHALRLRHGVHVSSVKRPVLEHLLTSAFFRILISILNDVIKLAQTRPAQI